jgi:hypothetical protein
MATVTGKMTVDLYANPDPFVQGMKAAENAAKKSGSGIAGHIAKINAKQMKGAVGGLLGGLGAIGLIDAGLNAANELVKGFKDGSIKGFGEATTAIGETIAKTLEDLPIAGAGGKLIASILDSIGYMGGAFGQEQQQQQSRIEAAAKEKANYAAVQASEAAAQATAKIAEQQRLDSQKKYQEVLANENKERQNAADILADIITDTEKLGKTEMEIFLIDLKRTNLHSDEYQKIVDAKTEQLQLEKDISKEAELHKQIQEWNTEDLKKGQEIADAAAKNLEQANRSNAMPGVDSLATAIGSVKVAGSADFSKQTELLNSAKKANDIATAQLAALKQIVDNSGGTA